MGCRSRWLAPNTNFKNWKFENLKNFNPERTKPLPDLEHHDWTLRTQRTRDGAALRSFRVLGSPLLAGIEPSPWTRSAGSLTRVRRAGSARQFDDPTRGRADNPPCAKERCSLRLQAQNT